MRHKRYVLGWCLGFILVLVTACAAPAVAPTATPTPAPLTPTPTSVPPTVTPTSAPEATPSSVATTPPPTVTPMPKPSPIVTGLVYSVDGQLWRVTEPGQVVALDVPDWAALSPDGAEAVYTVYEAGKNVLLWKHVLTGEQRRLPDVGVGGVGFPFWWAARPGWITVGISSLEEGPAYGFLSVMRSDGRDFQILDADCMSNSFPAPSPNGDLIAYDCRSAPWLYRWGSGPELLDLTDFGFTPGQDLRIGSPAWSPDGTRLAWVIGGDLAGAGWRIGILVLDLKQHTHDILFDYEPMGRGGWPPAPVWSPDGRWLAFQIWGEDGRTRVVRVDDKNDVHLLGRGKVVWAPDGLRLAYADGALTVVDVATWQPQPGLPLIDAQPVAWLAPTAVLDPAVWDVVTDTLAAPNGVWFAQQTTAYPRTGRGARLHNLLTVSRADGARAWTLVDAWEESALGMTTLRPLQWGRLGRALYLSHVTIPDGCPGLINGSDLFRFDVDAGTLTELLPSQGRIWMRLSPDDRTLAYGALTLRDLATGEERHVSLDVAEDATSGHIVWSRSGRALALTVVAGYCGPPEARVHTIFHVDTTVLAPIVALTDKEHGFVTVAWPEGNAIQLEDKHGQTWWLDMLTGEVVPDEKAAATLAHGASITIEEYPIVSADVDNPFHLEYYSRLTPAILDARREWRMQAIREPYVTIGDDRFFIASDLHTLTVYNGDTAVYTYTLDKGWTGPIAVRLSAWDDRWVLEALPGKVIIDGESLNERLGYAKIFGWRLLAGKPFFFFGGADGIGLFYDGQVLPYHYDEVPYYLCCVPAIANPGDSETMVWFHGLRDGMWYYVEMGIYE